MSTRKENIAYSAETRMRDHPIIFTGPMVRALLDGSKTQTRRILKPQPTHCNPAGIPRRARPDGPSDMIPCLYGKPGDRLWVRETLGHHVDKGHYYTATGMHVGPLLDYELEPSPSVGIPARAIPSIQMPRWASRILLEIVSVRVERLNDCSDADARAEGTPGGHDVIPSYNYNATPSEHYSHLWESINGAGSWAVNPWVWVIEFKRVTP